MVLQAASGTPARHAVGRAPLDHVAPRAPPGGSLANGLVPASAGVPSGNPSDHLTM